MKRLSAKNIGYFSKGYFAFIGALILVLTYFTGGSGLHAAFVLFGWSTIPLLLPFRLILIVYGILAFMVSFSALVIYVFGGFHPDINTSAIVGTFLLGSICSSVGLIYSATSIDQNRFTLI